VRAGDDRSGRPLTAIIVILAVAAALRFTALGSKPLWLDEAMTTLIALGRGPADVPIDRAVPLGTVDGIFTRQPAGSAVDVVRRLQDPRVQHTHPPLYYVIAHAWFALRPPTAATLAWRSRVVPATFGVIAVFAIYSLGRAVAGQRAGLIAAALAAVSPVMVLIAQEARNYTLPLVFVALACRLIVAILDRLADDRQPSAVLWAAWIAVNVLGCYAHYFVMLSVAAQVVTLAVMMRSRVPGSAYIALAASTVAIGLAFLPWLPTFAAHARSPEQAWMHEANPLVYVFGTLRAWQAMVQGWPLDRASGGRPWLAARLLLGLGVLAIFGAGVATTGGEERRPAVAAMTWLTVLGVAGLWAGSMLQQKNLAGEYRYHFVYYPAMIVLLGAVLARLRPWLTAVVLLLGAGNSVLFLADREYVKPTRPGEVAATLRTAIARPTLLALGEASFHETVVGLTYLRELAAQLHDPADVQFEFIHRSDRYPTFVRGDGSTAAFWLRLADAVPAPPPTIWIYVPQSLPDEYPARVALQSANASPSACTRDEREADRTADDDDGPRGPFRLYHCAAVTE
jgi:uncharacterized membrane protein